MAFTKRIFGFKRKSMPQLPEQNSTKQKPKSTSTKPQGFKLSSTRLRSKESLQLQGLTPYTININMARILIIVMTMLALTVLILLPFTGSSQSASKPTTDELRTALKIFNRYDTCQSQLTLCDDALETAKTAIDLYDAEVTICRQRITATDSAYAALDRANHATQIAYKDCDKSLKREKVRGTLKAILSGIGGGIVGTGAGILIGIFAIK